MFKILYDGDPGIDDSLAILLATRIEEVELIGVTTVSGNCSTDQATKNALNVLELLAGKPEIPVAKGAIKPLLREPRPSYEIHGSDGLGETHLPEPASKPLQIHALDMIFKACRDFADELIIVTGGPLTNLALAVTKEPKLLSGVKKIVAMGGCIRSPGNVTPAAEYNIYHDPEAASIVFHSDLPLTLVSLDVTAQDENLVTHGYIRNLNGFMDTPHRILRRVLTSYIWNYMRHRFMDGCYLHDTLAMLIALRPEILLDKEHIYVDIETKGETTLGRTQADLRRNTSKPPNIVHCLKVDYAHGHRLIKELLFK